MSIYLDSAAMMKPLPCALNAYNHAPFGNPSSEHAVGHAAREALEQARENIARLLGCDHTELYFTSTATESAATVLRSIYRWIYATMPADTESPYCGWDIVPSTCEHHAVLNNIGYSPLDLSVKGDRLWCLMYGNNEIGAIETFQNNGRNDLWLCDATASVGHIPVSFNDLGADYLLADALKFGGVPGAAILIAKKGAPLTPLILGGGQERGMRSGTENVPAICAMAAALEWQTEHMEENTQHIAALRQMMVQILSRIPDHKWNTPFDKPCLPHILNISFDGVDAHALALLLSNDGVMVSPGAACSNGLHEPSHVIMAMFHDEARARSAIRISFSHENTPDEIVEAGTKITEAVKYLRSIS